MIFRRTPPDTPVEAAGMEEPAAPEAPTPATAETTPAAQPNATVLGAETVLEGNIVTSGPLTILGTVNGAVQAAHCVIEEGGAVHGPIVAETLIIRGQVVGHICSMQVTVASSSSVEGDILNTSIAIETGAAINGKITRSDDPLSDWQQMWSADAAPAHSGLTGDAASAPSAALENSATERFSGTRKDGKKDAAADITPLEEVRKRK
ncbi:MAG TPA: polymer-forming cytoskeletal protein [Thermopetrobacter sp.]|nr:polymer-forming cytoskeletal protein [Thermopetrobacter sp.]